MLRRQQWRHLVAAAVTMPLLLGASPAGAASKRPISREALRMEALPSAPAEDLRYQGGPVMPSVTTYAIYWEPSSQTTTPGYKSIVDGFLQNVAAASATTSNVYGVTPQYADGESRAASYEETFGGQIVDTDSYPTGGCRAPGRKPCLTDLQIQQELEAVTAGLPHDLTHLYLMLLPAHVAVCRYGTSGCTFADGICGYHWWEDEQGSSLYYAVIPFPAGQCIRKVPHPNEKDADTTINTISHETIESITDPRYASWQNGSASAEIADECESVFGPPLGGKNAKQYNQVIGSGRYYLQDEWSNRQRGCVARPPASGVHPPDAAMAVDPLAPAAGEIVSLDGSGSTDAEGTIDFYEWQYGDGASDAGMTASHAYASSGYYPLRLTVTDSDELIAASNRTITVGGGAASVADVGAGGFHTCAVLTGGSAGCWGRNDFGQLGNGETTCSSCANATPGAVMGLTEKVRSITGGVGHTCALLEAGSIECWGLGEYGQLGQGSTADSTTPIAVSTSETGLALTSGAFHNCERIAVTNAVQCWGENQYGQLGDGTTTNQTTPVPVPGLEATAIAAGSGSYDTCAVTPAAAVECWGEDKYGQLGDGTVTSKPTTHPVVVSGIKDAISVTAGERHACALLSDHTVTCWGDNQWGELGNGSTTSSPSPVPVTGINDALSISAGYHYTCARLADQSVRCWGEDQYGQLGSGQQSGYSTTPVSVTGLQGPVSQIATGADHTCAVLTDGVLECWGRNGFGQLGDGDITSTATPTPVLSIP